MLSKTITTTEEFYNLQEDWERLQEQDPDVTYYSTFEFAKAWWDAYKNDQDKELFIVCIYQDKDIVGIAPFIIQKENKKIMSWNTLRFLGRGDFLGILVDRSNNNEMTIIKDIFKCIEDNTEKWERLSLTHIKHNSSIVAFILKSGKYNRKLKYLIECPYILLNKYRDFAEFNRKFVSGQVRNYRNKLMKNFNYQFRIVNNKDIDMYDEISKVHKKEQEYLIDKYNRKERKSIFTDKKKTSYLKQIYKNNSKVLTFMLTDGENNLLGYDTCYLYKGVLHSWNIAYNPEFEKYRIGKILNYEIVKYVFKTKIADVFDFGAGRYPWKFEWTNDFVLDYQLDMWNEETEKGKKLKRLFELKKKISR
ncbi:GNAT family N-acetyltransferase [Crassaminicella profunda]|uniref:GNAT family N-acetyltransferase n=1 Tax=Crassaminicella profunda TaxID=1286698 RepID=UPI001CA68954|nr:GNAT family N-acetyltransferase [Crassaminicella profunda]QZY55333.1 GNAT family N-acetyltransferase [Crassaminicella profunda]